MQRFDARNHRFVWVGIRLINSSNLNFESALRTSGRRLYGETVDRFWRSFLHSISPIEFLNRSHPFFEFVFAAARSQAL
jgi:hypothetical protein